MPGPKTVEHYQPAGGRELPNKETSYVARIVTVTLGLFSFNKMDITWSIIENPADSTFGIKAIGPNPDMAWPYFFNGVSISRYPYLITTVAEGIGYSTNGTGINFPDGLAQLDPEETPIPVDAVEVYVPGFDDSVLPRSTFYAVLLAFAERLLARPDQPAEWYTAMHTALDKLRAKMAADAAASSRQ